MLEVALVEDKQIETFRRWFCHVHTRPIDAIVRQCYSLNVIGTLKKEEEEFIKKKLQKNRKNDLKELNLSDSIGLNRLF